mgnify:CR=1 FL=1
MNVNDRSRGALYGLAVGDALGAAVEFRQPGTFEPVTCYRAGGPHDIAAGEWTDDTSMALALANSIGRGWNMDDQIKEYIEWYHNGKYSVNGWCFDIGGTTKRALETYFINKDVKTCADPHPDASGNGSIMRLAPVAIYASQATTIGVQFDEIVDTVAKMGLLSSHTTHSSEQCRSACRYMSVVLTALICGEDREKVLSPDWKYLDFICQDIHPQIESVIRGSFRENKTFKGTGWVVESLEAALWAFHDAKNFEEAVLKAVNLGEDADTTGAVCGQFAGAFWGESGIPESLLAGLAKKDMIESALTSLGVGKATQIDKAQVAPI